MVCVKGLRKLYIEGLLKLCVQKGSYNIYMVEMPPAVSYNSDENFERYGLSNGGIDITKFYDSLSKAFDYKACLIRAI